MYIYFEWYAKQSQASSLLRDEVFLYSTILLVKMIRHKTAEKTEVNYYAAQRF